MSIATPRHTRVSQHAKSHATTLGLLAFLLLLIAVWIFRKHLRFDWPMVGSQLRHAALLYIIAAVALTHLGHWLRAIRWAVLLSPVRKVHSRELIPAQFIGFTLIALLGRAMDFARPWIIARRTHIAFATQLAVYSIERAFDLSAAAILFSLTLLLAPHNTPHHEAFARAGILSLTVTLAFAGFAVILRFAGNRVANLVSTLLRPLSSTLAESATNRILDFNKGLDSISSVRELLAALALSLILWSGYAAVYWCCAHAFPASPQLAAFGVPATMLLLATAMGGSLFQLPVVGWFTQIAVLAAALRGFFAVPLEPATACATVILFATTLCIAPAGIVLARVQGITLRDAARGSAARHAE